MIVFDPIQVMLPRHLQKQPHGPDWLAPHTQPIGTYFADAVVGAIREPGVCVDRHAGDATNGSKVPFGSANRVSQRIQPRFIAT